MNEKKKKKKKKKKNKNKKKKNFFFKSYQLLVPATIARSHVERVQRAGLQDRAPGSFDERPAR